MPLVFEVVFSIALISQIAFIGDWWGAEGGEKQTFGHKQQRSMPSVGVLVF